MKKFFSLIALVGVFAACQPEELKTIFQSSPAQLTINVSKVINSVNGADVTSGATKTPYSVTGTPAIPAGVGTVSATYNGATGSLSVPYPAILADTDPVTIDVTVHIPGSVGDYTIDVKPTIGADEVAARYILKEAKSHGISHDGSLWLENASDYNLNDSCTYTESTGEALDGDVTVVENAFAEIVNANAEVHNPGILEEEKEYKYTIPAWSWYQVVAEVHVIPVHYDVVAEPKNGAPTVGNNNVVGSFDSNLVYTVPVPNYMAHPSHADHYGHYTGHGNGSNAGGGLVEE